MKKGDHKNLVMDNDGLELWNKRLKNTNKKCEPTFFYLKKSIYKKVKRKKWKWKWKEKGHFLFVEVMFTTCYEFRKKVELKQWAGVESPIWENPTEFGPWMGSNAKSWGWGCSWTLEATQAISARVLANWVSATCNSCCNWEIIPTHP